MSDESKRQHIEIFAQSGEFGYMVDGRCVAYGFKTEAGAKSAAKPTNLHRGVRLKWNKVDRDIDGTRVIAEVRI